MDQLYVFGGTAKKGINSIEILDLTGTKNWEVVQLDIISGRGDCIFCPINDKDLLIMAGSDVNLKRDSFLFNVKKKQARLFKQDIGFGLRTVNPTILQQNESVVALVHTSDWHEKVIRYDTKYKRVTELLDLGICW